MPDALTILKEDERFKGLLSYEELFKLGRDHIATFSGKLWTDYNVHDPGITILEMLCYALTDLGYRTRLNTNEILAPASKSEHENNFFTPEQVLTVNPLTITDYRKMLVDIKGVRNAWLVPASQQEIPLYSGGDLESLSYTPSGQKEVLCDKKLLDVEDLIAKEVVLNGLYDVYIDVEPILTDIDEACGDASEQTGDILAKVKERLHQHRNLGEDFRDIRILKDEEIGICIDVELYPDAQPDDVLGELYNALDDFFSPRLKFYSLRELLDKGTPIEKIFEGRPYTLAYKEPALNNISPKYSHGFVDVDQLEKQELPTVIYASDVYKRLMKVEGVRAIKSLYLRNFIAGNAKTDGEEWMLHLTKNHRPVFSLTRSVFNFYKGVLRLPVSSKNTVEDRFKKRLADFQKSKYLPEELDLQIPYGKHRSDLGSYYSIQNEFPLVYRIGKGQMPETEQAERKVKALQLKAYLSFFDQLLANYLAQLANIRKLYALDEPLEGTKATYFSQGLSSLPDAEKIFRYFKANAGEKVEGGIVAKGVQVYEHPVTRDLYVQQLIDLFKNAKAEQQAQLIEIVEDKENDYFTYKIKGLNQEDVFISYSKFSDKKLAVASAQSILFLGIFEENYQILNRPNEGVYAFNILGGEPDYLAYLTSIGEQKEGYLERRDLLLNHLLARFGEQFTEYVLLMYALNQGKIDKERIIRDKTRFLSNYPSIGRNRGKGFNYTLKDEIWNTEKNVSGVEKRVAGLMGLENWERKYLNNFEVIVREQEEKCCLLDHRGRIILELNQDCDSECKNKLAVILCNPDCYQPTDCDIEGVYGIQLLDYSGKSIAIFKKTFEDADKRDLYLNCIQAYFCESLNWSFKIIETEKGFLFQFKEEEENVELISERHYEQYSDAFKDARVFDQQARKKEFEIEYPNFGAEGFGIKVRVKQNSNGVTDDIVACYPVSFDEESQRNAKASKLKMFIEALLANSQGINIQLDASKQGYYFFLLGDDDTTQYLTSYEPYATEKEACNAWVQFLPLAKEKNNYSPINGNFNGGPHSFAVIDGKEPANDHRLAFHPRGYLHTIDRDYEQDLILSYLSKKNLRHEVLQDDPLFSWIFKEEDQVLLTSNYNFKYGDQAQDAWSQFLKYASEITNYYIESRGKEHHQLFIQKEEGLYIAQTEVFKKWSEAIDTRNRIFALLNKYPDSLESNAKHEIVCIEGKYFFTIYDGDGQIGLKGIERFETSFEASCAFYKFAAVAAKATNYREVVNEGTCFYSFEVEVWNEKTQKTEVLAEHPRYYLLEEKNAVQEALIKYIDENRIHFAIEDVPFAWHFEIWWESCAGNCLPLFVGTTTSSSKLEAKQLAKNLLERCQTVNLEEEIQLIPKENGYSFYWKVDAVVVAEHPNHYPSFEQAYNVYKDALNYLMHYCEWVATESDIVLTRKDKWEICGKTKGYCAEDDAEEIKEDKLANCLLSTFRLTKANDCIAKHPLSYQNGKERDDVKTKFIGYARDGKWRYSDILLKGDGLICKIGKKYHYDILATIPECYLMWRSIKGYDTETEAIAAFQKYWLKIIRLSKKLDHYQAPNAEYPYLSLCNDNKEKEKIVFSPLHQPATTEEVHDLKMKLYETASLFPIAKEKNGFIFQLMSDELPYTVMWKSCKTYNKLETVRAAFFHFFHLLKYEGNYRCVNVDGACLFLLEIREILLVSEKTYADDFELETLAYYTEEESDIRTLSDKLPAILEKAKSLEFSKIARRTTKVTGNDAEGKAYRFQLVDTNQTAVWESVQTYSSRRKAALAYDKVSQLILQLSRNEDNYEIKLDEKGQSRIYLKGAKNTTIASYLMKDGEESSEKIKELIEVGAKYPFVLNNKGEYLFQLLSKPLEGAPQNQSYKEEWLSPNSYKSLKEAEHDFQRFLSLRNLPHAYSVKATVDNKFQLAIKKVYLKGEEDTSENEEIKYEICPIINPENTIEVEGINIKTYEQCPPIKEGYKQICPSAWTDGLQNFLIYAIDGNLFYPYLKDTTSCKYSFRVVTDKYRVARSLEEVHTPAQREKLRNWLYAQSNCNKKPLLEIPGPKVMEKNGRCHYYLESETPKISWIGNISINGNEAPNAAFTRRSLSFICAGRKNVNYEVKPIEAENGIQLYCLQLTDPHTGRKVYSSEPFLSEEKANACINYMLWYCKVWYPVFKLRYKHHASTNQSAPLNIAELNIHQWSNEEETPIVNCVSDINAIKAEAETENELLTFTYSIPEVLWCSYKGYATIQSAELAFNEDIVSLFSFAQEQDCYDFIKHKRNENGTTYQISILDRNARILAVSLEQFKEETHLGKAIEERILYARRFPYFEYEGKFGFQCYSTEDLPDFYTDDNSTNTYHPFVEADFTVKRFNVDLPGKVIWESIQEYTTLDQAVCAFKIFWHCLIRDIDNYQRIHFEDCNLFGLELTHPSEVLADHPSSYDSYNQMLEAIERTKACINTEGFHLVEHILLRPKEGIRQQFCIQFLWKVPLFPELKKKEHTIYQSIPYLLSTTEYTSEEAVSEARDLLIGDVKNIISDGHRPTIAKSFTAMRKLLANRLDLPPENIETLLYVIFGLEQKPTTLKLKELSQSVEVLTKNFEDCIRISDRAEGTTPDALMPNCPDFCHAEALPVEGENEVVCTSPKALLEAQITKTCDESGSQASKEEKTSLAEYYIPGVDPYSFWTTVVLPYWPERFQNINFRRFFENTLRREFPAHIGIRICWLDPKQMLQFEYHYRNWLEAFSGKENCNLQEAKARLIDILFGMTTVYPPAKLQGGDCEAGSGDPNTILLDYTQLS